MFGGWCLHSDFTPHVWLCWWSGLGTASGGVKWTSSTWTISRASWNLRTWVKLGRWKGLIGFVNVSVFWLSWWENRLPSKINRVTSWGVGAESMRTWRGIGEFGICPDSCSEAKIWWVPRSSRHRRRTFPCLGQSLHWIIPTCVDSMLHMWHTFLHDWAICWSKCWWIFQQHAAILQYYIYIYMYPLPGCIESWYPHKPVGYKRPQICWLNAPI